MTIRPTAILKTSPRATRVLVRLGDDAEHVRPLVVDDRVVKILDGKTVLAEHARSWGRRQVLELAAHRTALVAERQAARALKGRDRLRAVAPMFDRIVARWDVTGSSLGFRVT